MFTNTSLTSTQYECSACDAIDRAVKCDQHGDAVLTVSHDHLRCKKCNERIVFLSPDMDDGFGFDDDAGEEDE